MHMHTHKHARTLSRKRAPAQTPSTQTCGRKRDTVLVPELTDAPRRLLLKLDCVWCAIIGDLITSPMITFDDDGTDDRPHIIVCGRSRRLGLFEECSTPHIEWVLYHLYRYWALTSSGTSRTAGCRTHVRAALSRIRAFSNNILWLCAAAESLPLGRIGRWSGREIARSALSLARSAQVERDNESCFFVLKVQLIRSNLRNGGLYEIAEVDRFTAQDLHVLLPNTTPGLRYGAVDATSGRNKTKATQKHADFVFTMEQFGSLDHNQLAHAGHDVILSVPNNKRAYGRCAIAQTKINKTRAVAG
ncbi:hypothetical protein EVAR_4196_1 [Eumeta japonica]|uniref:Uncharacterized protein n=1 Tax=Eumeta variegata TaxID=151549 RepID=A0A4C1TJH0_EUMVA|nr:hypothetical protein EVAR_4196_1 [Eumeta japonica]